MSGQIAQDRVSGQIAQHVTGTPALPLRPFVTRYTGYRYEGFPAGVHAGLPSQHLTFIVSLGDPIDVGVLHEPTLSRERFDALLGGLHTRPAAIHHTGDQYGVQLDVTPHGARALFGMPAAEVVDTNVAMDRVLGRLTVELIDRLHETSTWAHRFTVIDDVLSRALTQSHDVRPQVAHAWRRMVASGGGVEVADLATEVGYSRRHLTELFRREYGLAPKTFGRVVRFDRARRMLAAGTHPTLGALAHAAGYADQAHMDRDWRQFAGASPTRWLSDEQFPFFERGGGAARAR